MKRIIITALAAVLLLSGCVDKKPVDEPKEETEKFQTMFDDVFDTVTTVTAYCGSQEEFDNYVQIIRGEMQRLHHFFDIYNDYEGINNLKTVNDMAGIEPVKCAPEIIELITEGVTAHEESGGAVNITIGSVIRLWHDARKNAEKNPDLAAVPDMAALEAAAVHTDITKLVIDEAAGTLYLEDPKMSLDVGAFAKGWAVERTARLVREAGMISGLISAGGNVIVIGKPLDDRDAWSVGVRDPFSDGLFDAINAADLAVVTSGDYERFFTVDGVNYHHIIDPATLFPATRFSSVTILHTDSGIADMLSTPVFVLPHEAGAALVEKYSAQALWIYADGTFKATDGYAAHSSSLTD